MISKTLSGICFLDEPYGGVYAGRSVLVCGRSGTGKTTFGFQFIQQGLRQEDRCLILSTLPANDYTILAESLGFSFAIPIDLGQLILLEYSTFVPGRLLSEWPALPPDGYNQLREIIEANNVRRVVLDTVLPWVSVARTDIISEHVFSFVRSFDRLGVTTLMTLPKPVSSMAFRLKKALDDVVPISVLLSPTTTHNRFVLQIVKYLGEKKLAGECYYSIEQGVGLKPLSDDAQEKPSPSRSETVATPAPVQPPAAVRLSNVVTVERASPASPMPTADGPSVGNAARISNVWKPDFNPQKASG